MTPVWKISHACSFLQICLDKLKGTFSNHLHQNYVSFRGHLLNEQVFLSILSRFDYLWYKLL